MNQERTHDINPKVVNWLIGIFVSILLGIVVATAISETKRGSCTSSVQRFLHREYQRCVKKVYEDPHNHKYETVVFEDGRKTYDFDGLGWEKIQAGDIVVKKRNELSFLIIRNGDTIRVTNKLGDCMRYLDH